MEPESAIFPSALLVGVAFGAFIWWRHPREKRTNDPCGCLYTFTVGIATTVWVGILLISLVGGAGRSGPVQYAMHDAGALEVFRARGWVTLFCFGAAPLTLLPFVALFVKQPGELRLAGLSAIIAIWLGAIFIVEAALFPTV